MAPKKEKAQKLTLGEFIGADLGGGGGSWADEVEDFGTQPLPPLDRRGGGASYGGASYGGGGSSSYGGGGGDRGYSTVRDNLPQEIPDRPPYTLHLGNLSYDATQESVTDFFTGCNIVSVRIIEDREQQRPKGFAYAEFSDREGLVKALTLDGTSFEGRSIRIKVADPPKEGRGGYGDSTRDLSSWERKGPLPDIPGRSGGDRPGRTEFSERRAPREPFADDGKVRDFGNWERRGPLAAMAPTERPAGGSRDGSRPRNADRTDSFRDRHASPSWGPGQGREPREPYQEGARPPRREFSERVERAPTAAEQDNQWRTKMRPDAPVKPESQSREGSEAPASPAGAHATLATGGRPKLNLIKRTVSEIPAVSVTSPTTSEHKASPFGAARPIDTAAREKAIEEKRLQQIKEQKEAEIKAKEDARLAKEAAAKEAAEKAAADEAAKEAAKDAPKEEIAEVAESKPEETPETKEAAPSEAVASPAAAPAATPVQNGEQKIPVRTREPREPRAPREPRGGDRGDRGEPRAGADFAPRATESGNWRSAGAPRGGPAQRGGRGAGAPRGPREGGRDGPRPPRANGGIPAAITQPAQSPAGEPEATIPKVDEDGWTTVAAPVKARRGGRMNMS